MLPHTESLSARMYRRLQALYINLFLPYIARYVSEGLKFNNDLHIDVVETVPSLGVLLSNDPGITINLRRWRDIIARSREIYVPSTYLGI